MTNSQKRKKATATKEDYRVTNLYVIRKYIYAKSAGEAIVKEKESPVDDAFMHEGFQTEKIKMGFI